MSIKELLARNQRGLPLTGKQPIYGVHDQDSDEDAFNFPVNSAKIDLAERESLMDALAERQAHLKESLKLEEQQRQEQKKKQSEAREKEEFEKFRSAYEKLSKEKVGT